MLLNSRFMRTTPDLLIPASLVRRRGLENRKVSAGELLPLLLGPLDERRTLLTERTLVGRPLAHVVTRHAEDRRALELLVRRAIHHRRQERCELHGLGHPELVRVALANPPPHLHTGAGSRHEVFHIEHDLAGPDREAIPHLGLALLAALLDFRPLLREAGRLRAQQPAHIVSQTKRRVTRTDDHKALLPWLPRPCDHGRQMAGDKLREHREAEASQHIHESVAVLATRELRMRPVHVAVVLPEFPAQLEEVPELFRCESHAVVRDVVATLRRNPEQIAETVKIGDTLAHVHVALLLPCSVA